MNTNPPFYLSAYQDPSCAIIPVLQIINRCVLCVLRLTFCTVGRGAVYVSITMDLPLVTRTPNCLVNHNIYKQLHHVPRYPPYRLPYWRIGICANWSQYHALIIEGSNCFGTTKYFFVLTSICILMKISPMTDVLR